MRIVIQDMEIIAVVLLAFRQVGGGIIILGGGSIILVRWPVDHIGNGGMVRKVVAVTIARGHDGGGPWRCHSSPSIGIVFGVGVGIGSFFPVTMSLVYHLVVDVVLAVVL